MEKVDLPSLFMVVAFTTNMVIGFYDPILISMPKEVGLIVLAFGSLFFAYVLIYLRSGFFGETEPKLDHLVTKGPYRFCRHPQYLSFIIMILGFDLMFRSFLGIVFTFAVSIPSVVHRGRAEDKLLKSKFKEEWERFAEKTGFLFPKLGILELKRYKNEPNSY